MPPATANARPWKAGLGDPKLGIGVMDDDSILEEAAMTDNDNSDRIAEFTAFRQRMNERILAEPNQVVRRFFALDTQAYQAGALDVKTKELLGLVASLVLRCDDCISYHVAQCREAGVNRDEMFEAFSVGLVVGGSIVIPHLRRAVDFLDKLEQGESAAPPGHEHP
jgi:AhpD family alkylhydroperoxidase